MKQQIRIEVLVENSSVQSGLDVEHGLCFHLQDGDECILFDTGQSDSFIRNAEMLGVDLSQVSKVVLSHGHYDHSGGLEALYAHNQTFGVFAGSAVTQKRFSIKDPQKPRSIGMPESCVKLINQHGFTSTDNPMAVTSHLFATGFIPRKNDYEDTGGSFFLDREGMVADEIADDQALWLRSKHGLVILLGCAHAGVVNTVEQIRALSGLTRVHAIIGGLHLLNAGSDRLQQTMDYLKELHPGLIAVGHCTGEAVVPIIQQTFPHAWVSLGAGSVFAFDL